MIMHDKQDRSCFFLFYFLKVMQEYKQISYDTIMVDLFFSTKIIS